MAHGTSRMPEPGSEAISPSPALSSRDPVVQSVRCCFLVQVSGGLLSEIRRFPGICTDLESGKEISVRGYEGREAALAKLTASRERLKVGAEALIDAGAAT